jgi:hypothetical protein
MTKLHVHDGRNVISIRKSRIQGMYFITLEGDSDSISRLVSKNSLLYVDDSEATDSQINFYIED